MNDTPELKAVFEKHPEKLAQVMEMARSLEASKGITDIVGTPEEAQFAVEHANRLVSLQSSWMLSGEDPEMIGPAWEQTVEMFKERDKDGKEILENGKPKLASDFRPFVRKAATSALEPFIESESAQIAALTQKLAGNYPTEEARAVDAKALEEANYNKAAFDYVLAKLNGGNEEGKLPSLPPNATPEQIAFQKQLEERQRDLDAKTGKTATADRKAARAQLDRAVQTEYEGAINRQIETRINAMKDRGEYLPEFVLNDKWINPATGKQTNVSAFGMKIYQQLNDKINGNPIHRAKLASYQALGAGGKDARVAEVNRLVNLYLPKIFDAEVARIHNGIRELSGKKPAAPANGTATAPRAEPSTRAAVVPSGMDGDQALTWARTEAAKQPGFRSMSSQQREELIMSLYGQKMYQG